MGVTILKSCVLYTVQQENVPAQVYLVRHEDLDVQFVGHPVLPYVELLELNEKVVWEGLQTHRLVRNRLGLGRRRVEIVNNLSLTEFAVRGSVVLGIKYCGHNLLYCKIVKLRVTLEQALDIL